MAEKKVTWKSIGMLAVGLLICLLFLAGVLFVIFWIAEWHMDMTIRAEKELRSDSGVPTHSGWSQTQINPQGETEIPARLRAWDDIQKGLKTVKTENRRKCPVVSLGFQMAMLVPIEPSEGQEEGVYQQEWALKNELRPSFGDGTRIDEKINHEDTKARSVEKLLFIRS